MSTDQAFKVDMPSEIQGSKDDPPWPEPQPLLAKLEPEPYPVDALPSIIREAVLEVAGFVKAPVAMVAASALATLSLACQAHADVQRLDMLSGPTGLFLLTIAESGERKSTCDGFFSKPIDDYVKAQQEIAKPALMKYHAESEAWEAKHCGTKDKIRQLAKQQKPTAHLEAILHEMETEKPKAPKTPRLIYTDATPEALAYGLAKRWPSGGIMSAEAGIVFGSHGMSSDSIMRNLGLLNQLWDGKPLSIDRRTSESFTVTGVRLTIALQVQAPTLHEFFEKSGSLARGSGFLARFLIAWPESTQGQRFIDLATPNGPKSWPALTKYHGRISDILEQPATIDESGALEPTMLTFSDEARMAWANFFNGIEAELAFGGELTDIQDVASKAADNVARLAALFHMAEGSGNIISVDAVERACRVVAWHLHEARRLFGELALPVELADAVRLERWLIKLCKQRETTAVKRREAHQLGPVRNGKRLDVALGVLAEFDRVNIGRAGKKILIWLNPALLGKTS